MGRMITQSDRPTEDLLAEYYNAFGPAAGFVKEYFTYWENLTRQYYSRWIREDFNTISYFYQYIDRAYKVEDFNKAQHILDQARQAAKNSSLALARVEFLQKGLIHAVLTWKVALAHAEREKSNGPDSYSSALRKLVDYRRSIEQDNVINPVYCYTWESRTWDFSAISLEGRQIVAQLPLWWAFQWDPLKVGEKEKWFVNDWDISNWHKARTDKVWEKQEVGQKWKAEHNEDYDGLAWYRTTFELDPVIKGKPLVLRFEAVDEGAEIWINGQKNGSRPYRAQSDWYTPFEILLDSELLEYGGKNTLTVQVSDQMGAGGIYRPVYILVKKE
jgi:hypothetical protein